jgi:hypothetical protein
MILLATRIQIGSANDEPNCELEPNSRNTFAAPWKDILSTESTPGISSLRLHLTICSGPPNLPTMISRSPRIDLYAPKTLAVMDQAFAAIWNVLKADDPFRDYVKDGELRIAVGRKLLNLVADGVTDPRRLRQLTIESILPGHWRAIGSRWCSSIAPIPRLP